MQIGGLNNEASNIRRYNPENIQNEVNIPNRQNEENAPAAQEKSSIWKHVAGGVFAGLIVGFLFGTFVSWAIVELEMTPVNCDENLVRKIGGIIGTGLGVAIGGFAGYELAKAKNNSHPRSNRNRSMPTVIIGENGLSGNEVSGVPLEGDDYFIDHQNTGNPATGIDLGSINRDNNGNHEVSR